MGQAKITISGVTPESSEVALDEETVIGRSVKADVQIEGDLVSRRHARLYREDGRWQFEDLGSRNGTLLNGVRTQAAELQSGDVLMIGYAKLVFESDDPPPLLSTQPHSSVSEFQVSFTESATPLESALLSESDQPEATQATVQLSYRDLVLVNQRVTTIMRISQQLATILDRNELLEGVMDTLFELFPQADRGAVVLRDAVAGFKVVATKRRNPTGATTGVLHISKRMIDLVRREGKSVLSADTEQDSRFSDRVSILGSAGRSIMCAPLARKSEFFGVIYLSTESLREPFRTSDLNLLQGIASPVAIFLKNADLISRIEEETQLRTSLSRYLSPDLVKQIDDGSLKANLGGEEVEGSVMFSDIVGFTAMSELLTATQVVDRLNQYFTSMLEAIFGWSGTVDKFGGDAILAVWGAPVPDPRHPLLAAAAALEMQCRLFELNLVLEQAGHTLISMALGINSGRFVAGNIGGQERIEWTVIGDTVNLAQRIESQGFRGCVLVADSTHAAFAGKAAGFSFEPVRVKGKGEPVKIHSIRTLHTDRGVAAAIPGQITLGSGVVRAIITKVAPSRTPRVTVCVAGEPKVGESVQFEADLPEHTGKLALSGRVMSVSRLLDSDQGRKAEVEVEWSDEVLSRLLQADQLSDAGTTLEAIER